VKTTDTAATARELAKIVSPGALFVSMQNGVDNAEQSARLPELTRSLPWSM